jgi:hypothetical protein
MGWRTSAGRGLESDHLIPTTVESEPTKCCTPVSRNPAAFIQVEWSAPVSSNSTTTLSLYAQRRLDSAHRRYLLAIRQLATVTKLLRPSPPTGRNASGSKGKQRGPATVKAGQPNRVGETTQGKCWPFKPAC